MDETTSAPDQPQAPESPAGPAPQIHGRFLFVDVAGLRAKQLRRGARPRLSTEGPVPVKAERVAMEEVRRGLVYYDLSAGKPAQADAEA